LLLLVRSCPILCGRQVKHDYIYSYGNSKKDSPHSYRLSFFSIAPSLSVLVVIVVLLIVVIVILLVVVIVVLLVVIIVIIVVIVVHEFHLLIVTSIVCLKSEKLYYKIIFIFHKETNPCF